MDILWWGGGQGLNRKEVDASQVPPTLLCPRESRMVSDCLCWIFYTQKYFRQRNIGKLEHCSARDNPLTLITHLIIWSYQSVPILCYALVHEKYINFLSSPGLTVLDVTKRHHLKAANDQSLVQGSSTGSAWWASLKFHRQCGPREQLLSFLCVVC